MNEIEKVKEERFDIYFAIENITKEVYDSIMKSTSTIGAIRRMDQAEYDLSQLQSELSRLREENQWISVEERLPEYKPKDQIKFLVVFYGNVTTGKFLNGEWWLFDGKEESKLHSHEIKGLTHWMKLPNPPNC